MYFVRVGEVCCVPDLKIGFITIRIQNIVRAATVSQRGLLERLKIGFPGRGKLNLLSLE